MSEIQDGTGSGNFAKVDTAHFLHTSSKTHVLMVNVSASKQLAFSAIGQTTIISGVEKNIFVIINNVTSANNIAVKSIIQSIQGEDGKPALFKGYIGKKTYVSGGTKITPTNFFAGSNGMLDVSIYSDNPTLDGGQDFEFGRIYMEQSGTTEFLFDGAMIIPPGGSGRVSVTGDPTASGTKIAVEVAQYFALDTESIT